jgi:putative ABC transport system permease protein
VVVHSDRASITEPAHATRGQIRTQFLSEAIPLALGGGALATAIYASAKGWAIVIPRSPGRAGSARRS